MRSGLPSPKVGLSTRLLLAAVAALALFGCASTQGPARRATIAAGDGPIPTNPVPKGQRRAIWQPSVRMSWQWQLDGVIDTKADAEVFDLDGFDTKAATVTALHRLGRHVICYLDVGAVESYRPDASSFPASTIGRPVDGWPQERYLDIRRLDLIGPVLIRRLQTCRAKGFDGVEGDVVDAYSNDSGFATSRADEIRFITWLAEQSHRLGLAFGLKNDPDLVPALVDKVEFAIVEDCYRDSTCDAYRPFVERGKAVFDAEYSVAPDQFCRPAAALRISAIAKHLSLDARRGICR